MDFFSVSGIFLSSSSSITVYYNQNLTKTSHIDHKIYLCLKAKSHFSTQQTPIINNIWIYFTHIISYLNTQHLSVQRITILWLYPISDFSQPTLEKHHQVYNTFLSLFKTSALLKPPPYQPPTSPTTGKMLFRTRITTSSPYCCDDDDNYTVRYSSYVPRTSSYSREPSYSRERRSVYEREKVRESRWSRWGSSSYERERSRESHSTRYVREPSYSRRSSSDYSYTRTVEREPYVEPIIRNSRYYSDCYSPYY
jgi:hypothetical protein